MFNSIFTHCDEIDKLTDIQRHAIMVIRDGGSETGRVERYIRDVMVWAVINRCSDVHFEGHKSFRATHIKTSVRHPHMGLLNERHQLVEATAKHFETKLFNLTATPQGASTPMLLSTRFTMEFPVSFGKAVGLAVDKVRDDIYCVDVRVEFAKTADGFAFTCRLLDQQHTPTLYHMGFSHSVLGSMLRICKEPSGMVLVSGPTGSGKTTLLHALLSILNDGTRSISTLENPVELKLHGDGPIKQLQIGGDITFARGLRSILRQDPDVIMVGEIRDAETMDISLQAAQTGHFLLSTLHANSGPETITRALDLTIDKRRDAYRLAECLKLVIAQRLLPVYAPGVMQTRIPSFDEREWLDTNGLEFMESLPETISTERTGKQAIIEAIDVTGEVKSLIRTGEVNREAIYNAVKEQIQFETLAQCGVRNVVAGRCRLADCMATLESNDEARRSPSLRARLARTHGLNLSAVSLAMDDYLRLREEGTRIGLDATFAEHGRRFRLSGTDADLLAGEPITVEVEK